MPEHDRTLAYAPPGPTLKRFMQSNARVRLLIGPLGSGKSSCAVAELIRRSKMQAKDADGIRNVKILIVRGTFGELKSATIPTVNSWLPMNYGKVTYDSPITAKLRLGDVSMEIHFMALDKDEDAKKVLSTEYSFCWLDESKEISKHVFEAIQARMGRFPGRLAGGCSWHGAILTTNPCSTDHWLYKTAIEEKPPTWEAFIQPSGLSAEAENLENLPGGRRYYEELCHGGKDPTWIDVNVHGKWGHLVIGRPVFESSYRDSLHCAKEDLEADPRVGLVIAADFGIQTSAAVIGQKFDDGRLIVLDELVFEDGSISRFADLLSSYISINYPDFNESSTTCFCDPSGSNRSMSNEETAVEIMNERTRWKWRPIGDNNLQVRLDSVRYLLDQNPQSRPNFILSPRCKMLRQALVSKYHFKLSHSGSGQIAGETPVKDHPWSDIADALQYLVLGCGGHDAILNRSKKERGERRPRFARNHNTGPFDGGDFF